MLVKVASNKTLTVVRTKITIKNKINKNVAMLLLSDNDGYTFDGWYTKEKGGKSDIQLPPSSKKSLNSLHVGLKKYKINTNYFVPMGLGLPDIESFQKYFKLTLINKNVEEDVYPSNYICKTQKRFRLPYPSWLHQIPMLTLLIIQKCKLKNFVINIKTTSGYVLKKLGVKNSTIIIQNSYF